MSEIVTNQDRAAWAAETLDFYKRLTHSDDESAFSDFLTDLRHLADEKEIDYHRADDYADVRYLEEIEEAREWAV